MSDQAVAVKSGDIKDQSGPDSDPVRRVDPKTGRFLPGNRTGGRKAGAKDRANTRWWALVDKVLAREEYMASLLKAADDDPISFLNAVSKRLPREVRAQIALRTFTLIDYTGSDGNDTG